MKLSVASGESGGYEKHAEISQTNSSGTNAPALVVPHSDKCAFRRGAGRWDVCGMCLSEEKLSSGALLGEARVHKAGVAVPELVLMRLLGSALASSRASARD